MEKYKELSNQLDEIKNQFTTECENHLKSILSGRPDKKLTWDENMVDIIGIEPPVYDCIQANAVSTDNETIWVHFGRKKLRLTMLTSDDIYFITDFVNELAD